MKKYLIGFALGVLLVMTVIGGAISDRLVGYQFLDRFFASQNYRIGPSTISQKILSEESVVIDVAERVSPSVVTVGVTKTQSVVDFFGSPIDPFGFFGQPQSREETIKQDIGSGFIIDQSGLVVTNKHVVADTQATYRVITNDDQEYQVEKIYRDPVNDMSILKITADGLIPVELGDSDNLKVGQFVVAIGTALGEFRHTVTTGVISGLGRGITAGSSFQNMAEEIDNVIQVDAAINPGNSGGPLLNSAGQVIGVNVAVAAAGENVGFALPINVVRAAIDNFNRTGQFSRPFLGVRYRMIDRDLALMNEVPQGAYIIGVEEGSSAAEAGIQINDIITKIDNQKLDEDNSLVKIINIKKIGDKLELEVWRSGETEKIIVTLKNSESETEQD